MAPRITILHGKWQLCQQTNKFGSSKTLLRHSGPNWGWKDRGISQERVFRADAVIELDPWRRWREP